MRQINKGRLESRAYAGYLERQLRQTSMQERHGLDEPAGILARSLSGDSQDVGRSKVRLRAPFKPFFAYDVRNDNNLCRIKSEQGDDSALRVLRAGDDRWLFSAMRRTTNFR